MENLRILILAAGKGTRMKSKKAKVLHQVGGASLLDHVVRSARPLSVDISVVVGHQAEQVKALFPEVKFVEQKEQLGTGHAVMAAASSLRDFTGDLLVLSGDAPLIRTETLERFLTFHRERGFKASVLTAEVADTKNYGRIIRRNDDEIDAIIEHKDASPDVRKIPEINSGIYVFNTPGLLDALTKLRNDNAQKEYYLTDVIGIMTGRGQKVGAHKAQDAAEIEGINTRQELAAMDRVMRRRKCERLMADGVTIIDPDSTFIDADVQIGADTVIYPSVQIQGHTIIGEDVTIRSFSRITNSRIGNRSLILEGCVVVDSAMGEDVSIGPYAHLRPGVKLEDTVHIGNFVELKKSTLDKGSKAGHLAYIGDATVGKNVNIGAGVITVNYDGKTKHPTHIEDDAFVGSDSCLIAPVRIAKGAFVAAGSTITDDVPEDGLAIARGRQVVKEGRAPHKKKK